MILSEERVSIALAIHGDGSERCRLNAWDFGDLAQHLFVHFDHSLGFRDALIGDAEAEREHLFRIPEAGIDLGQRAEGTDHQSRADQEHHGEGDLNDDQNGTGAMALTADA